jgi:5'-3' exonuclease
MITGDTVDNLPGIKGIGEVGACKLLDNKQIDIFKSYRTAVFDKYCEVYGEKYGIEMFYKMYNCLKMVHTYEVEIPELIKLKTEISEEERLFD